MKKYMKRMFSALLALVMLGGSIALTPMKSEAASNSYVETSLTTSGSTATLKVNLRNYRYLTNGKFVINYDSNVLSVRSTTKGSGTYTSFDIAEVNTQNAGEIVYGFASGTQSYKYGTLFTVDFDIKNVSRQDTTVRTQIAELVNAGTHYTTGETTLSDTISVGTEPEPEPEPVTTYRVTFYNQNQVYTTQNVASGGYATEPAAPVTASLAEDTLEPAFALIAATIALT